MPLHTPTLLLVNIAVAATLGSCLGAVANRQRRDGMVYWAWALAAQAVAYSLYSLRGQSHPAFSVVLANGLLAATFALFTEGLGQFQQRHLSRWLIWSPVVALTVTFSFLLPYPRVRVVLSAATFVLQCAGALWLLFRRRHDTVGRGQYFVASGYVFLLVVLLMRIAATLLFPADVTLITNSNLVQSGTFFASTVSIVLISLGLVLMTKERADEHNRILALQDELTGLNNRRSFEAAMCRQLAQAQRSNRDLSVLMIDIDRFKLVNDTFGHLSGDRALRGLADCIRGRLRAQDLAGRWGGEEFLVVLPDTDAEGAAVLAEQLRQAVERTRFEALDGRPMQFTISVGLHALRSSSGQPTVDNLIGMADQAMYLAKQKGRNRVERI